MRCSHHGRLKKSAFLLNAINHRATLGVDPKQMSVLSLLLGCDQIVGLVLLWTEEVHSTTKTSC